MIDWLTYLTFVAACVVVVIVPGPTVTLIIANGLRSGVRAGLLNVAGTQAGLVIMVAIVATGLEFIVARMAVVFDGLRLVGAGYLLWLGIRMLRANSRATAMRNPRLGSHFLQGFLVIWSNPKALVFLGAIIPQFVDPGRDATAQTLVLGGTFMAVATLLDGAYAVISGRAGRLLTRANVRRLELASGLSLAAGGVWLLLARR